MPPGPVYPAWQIYADQMFMLGYGLALWEPAPLSNYTRVNIGDLGYIRDGHFQLVFNIAGPSNGRRAGEDVPIGYASDVRLGPLKCSQPRDPGPVFSRSIRQRGASAEVETNTPVLNPGLQFSFSCDKDAGALLMTKYQTYHEDLQLDRSLQDSFAKHYRSWLAFAHEQGHNVELADLVLVTGVDLTKDFSMLAFASAGGEFDVGFNVGASQVASASASAWGSWRTVTSVHKNWGPQEVAPPGIRSAIAAADPQRVAPSNEFCQCVFVRGFRMRERRLLWPKVIKAAGDPQDLDDDREREPDDGSEIQVDNEEEDDADVVFAGGTSSFEDPLSPLFEHIFENTAARLAIVHDRDLHRMLELIDAQHIPEDIKSTACNAVADLVTLTRPPVTMLSGSVGSISDGAVEQMAIDAPLATSLILSQRGTRAGTMWALLIGVESYRDQAVGRVTGALRDVDRMWELLVHDWQVPPAHIIVLRDEEAKRQNIINLFQTHLIDNPSICHGDPILFYFSGLGSRVPAPSSWPIVGKDNFNERRSIDIILPYDSGRNTREARRDREITGIPERTLGSLLRKATAKHGPNITVILDCCGHGARNLSALAQSRQVRSVDAALVGHLSEETDRELWSDDQLSGVSRRPLYPRGAFVDRQDDTHVLLAACGRGEESHGSIEGGWFTTALIQALKDPAIYPRSYSEILKHVRSTFNGWYRDFQSLPLDQRPESQTPQCEGINRDRVIFQIPAVDRTCFPVHPVPHSPGRCRIDVGDVYGIVPGTMFELRQAHSEGSQYSVIGTAVVDEVSPGSCIAKLPAGVHAVFQGLLAVVTSIQKPLRYSVVNDIPGSSAAVALFDVLQQRLGVMSPGTSSLCQRVEIHDAPELVLHVGNDGVTLDRKDLQMSYLTTPPPFIEASSVRNLFPEVMAWFARFNFHLHRDNPEHPYVHEVDISLHVLKKATEDGTDSQEQDYMLPGKEYSFHGQEAVVPHEPESLYGLTLDNYSKQPLFPHIVYFDPATYSIDHFYSPINPHDPPLKPGGQLLLGRSSETMTAMSFFVQENQLRDTGFLKVYLSSDLLDLSYMEQEPVLGGDARHLPEHDRPHVVEEMQAVKGLWDVLTRKVTVDPSIS